MSLRQLLIGVGVLAVWLGATRYVLLSMDASEVSRVPVPCVIIAALVPIFALALGFLLVAILYGSVFGIDFLIDKATGKVPPKDK